MQYRRAIRHPQPAEREYLAAQSTGTGVHVGQHVQGGWLVDAAMAESPAEEAGIVRGDCITEISRLCISGLSKAYCFGVLQHSWGIECWCLSIGVMFCLLILVQVSLNCYF